MKTKNYKIRICFVCSENISRSLIAEYCLKEYVKKNNLNNLEISSAGTNTSTDASKSHFVHFNEFNKMGIDVSKHKRTQLTKKVIDKSDLVVAMAEYHQKWIKENFNKDVPMFSEIVSGKKVSFYIPPPDSPECDSVLRKMVHEITEEMPGFVVNMRKWLN